MNVMRRLKSFASGRTSFSSDPGGDSSTKRAKFDQETERLDNEKPNRLVRCATGLEQHMASTSLETAASASDISSMARKEKSSYEQLHLVFQLEACIHPFFDDLRDPNACLPNGRALPPLFDFTAQELTGVSTELRQRLIPEHASNRFGCTVA